MWFFVYGYADPRDRHVRHTLSLHEALPISSTTGTPAAASALAEPPVERISTPRSLRKRPNSARPDLSETESRARLIGVAVSTDMTGCSTGERLAKAGCRMRA